MKKILFGLLPLLMAVSCKKDLTSINVDPKNPAIVPAIGLFTNAQHDLANTVTDSDINLNIFRLIVQYWTQSTYIDESTYDLNSREIPRFVWNSLYRDVLRDFQEAKALIPRDEPDPVIQKNQIAVTGIMEVYTWYYLVTTFGNIPYSEALNIDNPFPKYDDQKGIFLDLLTRLDAEIAALDINSGSFGDADIIYSGDVSLWKKFAYTLKLKMGMTLADVDPAMAKSIVESAVTGGVFTSSSDDALYQYLGGPPNTNPLWVDIVQSNRKDFVVTSTLIDRLESLGDPRLDDYATTDASGTGYSGGTPGDFNSYPQFSKPSETILATDFPGLLLSYEEVEFFLAEAVERGFNVGGTAMEHYNKAITASITYWGGTAAEALSYLAKPSVNYVTAAGTYKQKIGEQKWIALYYRGWDSWIEYRRLDSPVLEAPALALSVLPLRYTYNVDEQNINTTNYNAAASAIGGDTVETKLFWDVN